MNLASNKLASNKKLLMSGRFFRGLHSVVQTNIWRMWLEALQGSRSSFKLPAKAIIGRSKSCDITLDDKRVSDRHCHVCISGAGACTVEDLSRNGTWVNGNR